MARTYTAGIVTAYGAAKQAGYTGTYEEFCEQQAGFAGNAAQVAEDRAAVEATKETFENVTVPAAVQTVQTEGATQEAAVTAKGTEQVAAVRSAGDAQTGRVQMAGAEEVQDIETAGTTQVNAVNAAGTTQVGAVNAAGTTQTGNVNDAGATQMAAIEAKGEETRESIPEDYSTLTAEVSDLKSSMNAISEVEEPRNYAVLSQEYEWGIPSDMTVEYADGAVTFSYPYASGNKANFGFIFDGLENGKVYNLSFELISGGLADIGQIKVSGLSPSKTAYNVVSQISKSGSIYSCEFTASINSTTPYNALNLSMVRATSTTAKLGNFSLIENGATPKTKVNNDALANVPEASLDEDIQDKLNISEVAYSDDNLIDFNKLTHGYIDSSNGTIHATGSPNSVTDFIPVVPGKFYYFKNVVYGYYAFYSSADVSGFLSGVTYQDTRTNWFVQIPSGVSYARFTVDETKLDSTWINTINKAPTGENVRVLDENVLTNAEYPENPCNYKGNEICIFKKILCIGDSLTEGVCNYYDGSTIINNVAFRVYSYPTFLKALTGRDTANAGLAGYTTAQWYAAKSATDYSGHDACIIQLGVNDALGSGWTSEAETAMGNIVSKIKSENNGIKIFIATIIPAFSYSGSAFDAVSAGIRAFVDGLNDPNVILLDMAVYAHTKEDAAYNNGHLTAFGYLRLAEDYKAYISNIIANDKPSYRAVQLTGTNYSLD